ncbi:uncharacterized protein LOC125431414 [Sphaerodactylus townsendi]|uniref:uncharacterized protein LOC125431414 n=1 Tax=Sphaerodactylus townsendi TaxID=933632 RepID=UPI0020274451|nr:uncharacterized protein LOC125431414 [Sphaerodactylus townsendi]
MFHLSTGTQGPKFAFNFTIPERLPPPSAAAVWRFGPPGGKVAAEAVTENDTPSREATEIPESLVSPKPDPLDATSGRCQRDDGSPSLKDAQEVVKSEKVEIQPGDAFPLGSVVVCRKQSGQPSKSSSWFTPSDSSSQFHLDRPERTPEEVNRTACEANGVDGSQEQTAGDVPPTLEGQREMFHFSTGTQGPKFAFNFTIPERLPPPSAAAVWRFGPPGGKVAAEAVTENDTPSREATEIPESLVSPKPDPLDAANGRCQRDDGSPPLEVTQEEKKEAPPKETSAAAAGRSSKRKKRKKQPSKIEPNQNVNEDNRLRVKATCDQTEMCQQPDEQLKREVDWCVEQLELGLKTQKPTPKQVDEMLRAIKTLRSEKAILAKKRQIMRFMFGDYRKKMAEDWQKQLKLMQTASKAARITEVTEDARRKSSQVFRKSVEVAGRSQNPKDPLLSPENPQQPEADFCPFTFTPSQEKFRFNFF